MRTVGRTSQSSSEPPLTQAWFELGTPLLRVSPYLDPNGISVLVAGTRVAILEWRGDDVMLTTVEHRDGHFVHANSSLARGDGSGHPVLIAPVLDESDAITGTLVFVDRVDASVRSMNVFVLH